MSYAILYYLYRDAANRKTYGEIAFPNPKGLTEAEIEGAIRKTLDGGEFFVAESLGLPTLYHDSYDPKHKDEAHGYHEFIILGVEPELPEGVTLDERNIHEMLKAFLAESEKDWPVVRDLDAEFGNAKVSAKLDNLIEVHVGKLPSKTFATSQLFWDCECDEHYIHPASEAECYACMARRDESPDSRVDEIQRYSDELPLELVALVNAAAESIDLGIADIPF